MEAYPGQDIVNLDDFLTETREISHEAPPEPPQIVPEGRDDGGIPQYTIGEPETVLGFGEVVPLSTIPERELSWPIVMFHAGLPQGSVNNA